MCKDTILEILGISAVVGLIGVVVVAEVKEQQRISQIKSHKRSNIKPFKSNNKLSADDEFVARYCYDYYMSKFNRSSSESEIDSAFCKINHIVSLVDNASKEDIVSLKMIKAKVDDEKERERQRQEEQRRKEELKRQERMMKELTEAVSSNKE